MNLNEELGELFIEEARELLIEQEQSLLSLESSPDSDDLVAKLFRSMHTLKGNSRILGFQSMERFSHQLENLLDLVRRHELAVTRDVIDVLLLCQDVLRDLVEEVAGAGAHDSVRYGAALERVTRLQSRSAPHVSAVPAVEPSRVVVALSLMPRAVRDSLPAQARASLADLEAVAAQISPVPISPAPPVEPTLQAHASTPAATDTGASVPSAPGDEPGTDAPIVDRPDSAPPAPRASAAAPGRPAEAPKGRAAAAEAESSSVRVPIDKLDRLINLTGEVVIAQSIIAELVSDPTPERIRALQEVVAQMDRHCRELQERMLQARMLPLRNVFARFPRLVRDLSATTGKSLRLEISGEDTELDKTVIEKIADPLTHLVRNAIDHGVEFAQDRVAAGKAPQACVKLCSYQKGGNIFIEVSDDGRGIDADKVLAKARALGLVRQSATLSKDEIFALIFQPGFSTAEKVTELSGRGVGMDVVKRNVEALKGSISISSTSGVGTCFRIKLPLTLAIMDGLGVRVGEQVYLVPLLVVAESLQPRACEVIRLPDASEVVDVRGQYIPLVRLYQTFGIERAQTVAHEGIVMVLDDGSQRIALLVDELQGQYQVVIKSLEANFRAVPGVAGATVLGDGRVALILDVSGLRALAPRGPRGTKVARMEMEQASPRPAEGAV